MDTKQAYDIWSQQYDTNVNKTRDLEGIALRTVLANIPFDSCLEIGCGTGKNTAWLVTKSGRTTSVDLSEEMLAVAKAKIASTSVDPIAIGFVQADITEPWTFRDGRYGLVSFSLVLEHIADLGHIFQEVAKSLTPGGHVYIGELHPFKQYAGSKARFETEHGTQELVCFIHHISDFVQAAKAHGLELLDINEFFDDGDRTGIPRVLTLLFRKK